MTRRAFILLLDSFGIGATSDAATYGDSEANTLRHIAEQCANGLADKPGVRQGPLQLPHLTRLGLNAAAIISKGSPIPGLDQSIPVQAYYGCADEKSLGKDTPSGHWEIAGVPVMSDWGYFPPQFPSFPSELLEAFISQAQLPGILGNKHASGTVIINELGEQHQQTGMPIVYTSADSVFQIAAHEQSFGLERLYHISEIARELVNKYNIGRVIARPFVGNPGYYYRTANRRDYTTPPPEPTLLDHVLLNGGRVIAIGKVADIYAHRGISKVLKGKDNTALFDALLSATIDAESHTLVFVNFVDFDMLYGHRRDALGYAAALETFDQRLPEFEKLLRPGDLAIITADHGCDPTWPGSDHTRERIPILAFGPGIGTKNIGIRTSFADIGQTIAQYLELQPLKHGVSFL